MQIVDSRTGLFNSAFLHALAGQELARALRYHRPLVVMVVEVDDAPDVRLSCGEHWPLVLSSLAQIISGAIRDTDTAGYLGGEAMQFGLLLPETDLDGAMRTANNIKQAVISQVFSLDPTHQERMTVSCGIAEVSHEYTDKTDNLFVVGSELLLATREEGSNRIRVQSRVN